MRNTVLAAGISVYWPLWLVCICGVILVIIAILALLLIKGPNELPATWKMLHVVLDKTEHGMKRAKASADRKINVRFYRIGRDGDAEEVSLIPQKWCSVGSGDEADFCLSADDQRLAGKHFQFCIRGNSLLVNALEQETFVNGVPIQKLGKVHVYNGDLIRAGSYEYRVIFSHSEEKENAT